MSLSPPIAEHGVRNLDIGIPRLFYVFPTNSFGDVTYQVSHGEGATPEPA